MTAFRCDYACIPLSWKCDGKIDCKDNSDEADCTNDKHCNDQQFKCATTGRCLPKDWLCDGDFDCGATDTSDEDQPRCRAAKQCLPNQSECASGICIDTVLFCDGKYDCISDEWVENCGTYRMHSFPIWLNIN